MSTRTKGERSWQGSQLYMYHTLLFLYVFLMLPVTASPIGSSALHLSTSCVRHRWIKDIEAYTPNSLVNYPIIADPNRDIASL